MKYVFILITSLLLISADGLTDTDAAIIKEARTQSQVMKHLDHLVNAIGPRLTSSKRLTQACEWSRDRFRAWGLDVRLEPWGTFPVGFDRGPATGTVTFPEKRSLTFATPAWSPGTDGLVSGQAMIAPDEITGTLKGMWILDKQKRSRASAKQRKAAYIKAGVAGIIYSTSDDRIVMVGNPRVTWEKLPTLVTIMMVKDDFDFIYQQLEQKDDVTLEFNIQNTFTKGPIELYNVIAEIKGSEHPDEYVLVGAHIDSWDGSPGCVDNGTGVSAVMEAARILMATNVKPKRSIRFILWTGEEQGLLGSTAYVQKHQEELKKYSIYLNQDLGSNAISGIFTTKGLIPIFDKVFAFRRDIGPKGTFNLYQVPSLHFTGGSDHASFSVAGVPAIEWYQVERPIDKKAHHTQFDVFRVAQEKDQIQSSLITALAIYHFANLDQMVPRDQLGPKPPKPRRLGTSTDLMVIQTIVKGSAAERSHLQVNDHIIKFNGTPVADEDALRAAIRSAPLQTTVTVMRDEKELDFPVQFDK